MSRYSVLSGCERFKWPLREPVKRLLRTDGAVTHTCCSDFGTRCTLHCLRAHREQLCLGGGVGGSPAAVTLPSPLTRAVTGAAEWDSGSRSCRVVLLKLIRHATPAWPPTVRVCVCVWALVQISLWGPVWVYNQQSEDILAGPPLMDCLGVKTWF